MDQVFHRGIALADLLEGMADELAAAIEDESHEAVADELFQRALKLAPVGDLADKIKNQQRRLADRVMRANAQGLRLLRGFVAAYAGAGTASTFRPNPPLDVEAASGELAVGEALVSFVDHKRRAHPGGAGPGGASLLHDHYREAQDRESAYELLRQPSRLGSLGCAIAGRMPTVAEQAWCVARSLPRTAPTCSRWPKPSSCPRRWRGSNLWATAM
jgi:hypothetical protein